MHWALNNIAQVVPDWLRALAPEEWYKRYERRPEGFRLTEKERLALIEQIGSDGYNLLTAVYDQNHFGLRHLPSVESLRQIWVQQFYLEDGAIKFRQNGNYPPGRGMIYSPYDLDARLGAKRDTEWQGYKVHLTETVDPDAPQLITDVLTDLAPATDKEVLPQLLEPLAVCFTKSASEPISNERATRIHCGSHLPSPTNHRAISPGVSP